MVAQVEMEIPQNKDKHSPSPQGVLTTEGAVQCTKPAGILEPKKVYIGPLVARIEGIRCIEGNPIPATNIIRYQVIRISWKKRVGEFLGIGDVSIEWANGRLTTILDDVEVWIGDLDEI